MIGFRSAGSSLITGPKALLICLATMLAWSLSAAPGQASYGIYVGQNCTTDGSVFLAGYGDEPSSHWLEIVPRRKHPAAATIKVGVTDEARYPGVLMDIPQAAETDKHITTNYSCAT